MGIRAIAIEDDEAVARLIAQVLTSHGFDVVGTAGTGEDGLGLARREKPDGALVALGLPKMSGEDVIAAIRKELPKTACIALTAVEAATMGEEGIVLEIVSSAVIGGVSIYGGVGSPLGAVIGALFITLITNSMNMLKVSYYWTLVIKGLVIVVAVALDSLRRR